MTKVEILNFGGMNMNSKNAAPNRIFYTSSGFPCYYEVIADELLRDRVVIRCVDENRGADARVALDIYDAKCLSVDILSGDLEEMASFKFEMLHGDYGIDDFVEVYCDSGGSIELDDCGNEHIVSRQMSLSATCAGVWKIEVLEGEGIADASGNIYLKGAPKACVSAILTRRDFRCLGHALNFTVNLWNFVKFDPDEDQELA